MTERKTVEVEWTTFEIPGTGSLKGTPCNFGRPVDTDAGGTLCLIPTYAKNVVANPLADDVKSNIMKVVLQHFTSVGARVLMMEGYADLWEMRAQVEEGHDPFEELSQRVQLVAGEAIKRGYANPGQILLFGTSRHGFACLHGVATCPDISGCITHQPIIWFPSMEEFLGMDDDPILNKNKLNQFADRFPPNNVLMQTGYNDHRADYRAGVNNSRALVTDLYNAYESQGKSDRFKHQLMEVAGHDGAWVPDWALDDIPVFLQEQGLV